MRSNQVLRSLVGVALLAGLVQAPVAAAERPFEVALVFAPSASQSELDGTEIDSAYGLGFGWSFRDAWAVELRGLYSDADSRFTSYEQRSFELGLRRDFRAAAAWRPFALAGARYRESRSQSQVVCIQQIQAPCNPARDEENAFGPFVGGGVDWRFAGPAALRFDGRLSLYRSDRTDAIEQDVDLSVGLVLRF